MYDRLTINFKGRLGNILFQYFCYLALCLENGIEYKKCVFDKIPEIQFNHHPRENLIKEIGCFMYSKIILDKEFNRLDGYFQSYKYFDTYKNQIFEIIELDKYERKYYADISIHIRHGDYMQLGIVLAISYYLEALKKIIEKEQDNKLMCNVFFEKTGDLSIVKKYINIFRNAFPTITFLDNINDTEYNEILSIGNSKYVVMSNGTFAWMGAYLGKAQKVFCPENWITLKDFDNYKDLFLPDWNVIEDTSNLNFLKKVGRYFYINLEKRKDRYEEINRELDKIDWCKKRERIDAVYHEKGYIGCTLSHIKTLEVAIERNYEYIMILEDDFEFLVSKKELIYRLHLLNNYDKDFDIVLLSRNVHEKIIMNEYIWKCVRVATTAGFIVVKKFYKILLENFKEAYDLASRGYPYNQCAIDINWYKLQGSDSKFYTFSKPLGKQRCSYSDIECRTVDYGC